MKRNISLQYKILTLYIIISVVPLTMMGVFSYSWASKSLIKHISTSRYDLLIQVKNRIDKVLSDVNDLSLFLLQNDTVQELLLVPSSENLLDVKLLKLKLYSSLTFFLDNESGISSIIIEGANGLNFTIDPLFLDNGTSEEEISLIEKFDGGSYIYFTTSRNISDGEYNVLTHARQFKNPRNLNQSLGFFKISVLTKIFNRYYEKEIGLGRSKFLLVDENNSIVSTSDKTLQGRKLDSNLLSAIGNFDRGWKRITIADEDYILAINPLEQKKWSLIYIVPLEEIVKDISPIRKFTLLFLIIMIAICVILSIFFSSFFLNPLKEFKRVVGKIANEDFNVRVNVSKDNELGQLGAALNSMADRLKELRNQVYLSKIKQKDAEMTALQAQINPHFLYNTLDTIYWMSRLEKAEETGELVRALGNLFRMNLSTGNSEFNTLENELLHIKSYMVIQKKRYEEKLNFTLQVDENLKSCSVVKLVLQPLVENALVHGLDKKLSASEVSLTITRVLDDIVYIIKDDGAGCDQEELNRLLRESVTSTRGLGIKNVHDRIVLSYGPDYGLEFSSIIGEGTIVTVRQPYHGVEDETT